MKTLHSGAAARFVDDLLGQGRYTFTRHEFDQRMGLKDPRAGYMSLYRLMRAGWVAMPRSGFYIILDPQHRAAGTLPPEWFVHQLLTFLNRPYYVGLLSAAQIHGAAHQRPQVFQVMVPPPFLRPVRVGNVLIGFSSKGRFDRSDIADYKTPTGFIKVSSPETTAWDLVRYFDVSGGLDHVLTVLAELHPALNANALRKVIRAHGDRLVARRLGYFLDRLGRRDLTRGIDRYVAGSPWRSLDPEASSGQAKRSVKWRLRVNREINPET